MNQNKKDTHNYQCAYADELRKEGLSNEELFPYLLAEFNGTPYVWGAGGTEGSDCSGTVCTSLKNQGYGRQSFPQLLHEES